MPRITPIHYRKLVKVFEVSGFVFDRQEGDHLIYEKEGTLRPVVIPMYKEVPVYIIIGNLRTAKMSRNEYLELLNGK